MFASSAQNYKVRSQVKKKGEQKLCSPQLHAAGSRLFFSFPYLLARVGRVARGIVGLRDAHIAADFVLPDLVDYHFFRLVRSGSVEKDWLVERAILLLKALVFHDHRQGILIALFVHALQLHGDVAYLLRFVFSGDGEFQIVAFTETAQLV